MKFASPGYFCLLLLTPALILLILWANRQRRKLLERFTGTHLADRLVVGFSLARRHLKQILLVVAVFFIALALTRPQLGFYWKEVHHRGIDIYVALDVSKSMLAQDTSPSRLERAKHKIEDLTKIVEGDRLGLIAFAGTSFVQCPLTLDYVAIQSFLASLGVDSISSPGTSIADAIEKASTDFEPQTDKARALLLLTDGEDLEGSVEAAVAQAKTRGVKIYAMGIGSADGAPIPNEEGGGFKKDAKGDLVLTRLMEKNLKDITINSGGAYVRSVPSDDDINQIYADIKSRGTEKEFKEGREKEPKERFQWPLLLAIFALLAEYVIAETIGGREDKKWRWRWKFKSVSQVAGFFILCGLSHSLHADVFKSDRALGKEAYDKGEYETAIQHFLSAQVDDPANEKLKYDLANSYYKAGKFDEATRLYQSLAEGKSKEVKEKSFYNLGNSQYRQGKMEEAAQSYEKALNLDPKDKDSKYNLDYVKKRLEQQKQQPKDSDKNKKDDKKNDKPSEDKSSDSQNSKSENQKDSKPGKEDPKNQKGKDSGKEQDKKKPQPSPQDQNQDKGAGKEEDKKAGKDKKDEPTPQPQDGKDAKGQKGEAGKEGESKNAMTPEEARMWLSRVKEKRPAAKKAGSQTIRGDKDW